MEEQVQKELLRQIQIIKECCREYPTQEMGDKRKLIFATMRIASERISAVCHDEIDEHTAYDIQLETNEINASLDSLMDRYGSDLPGHCSVCGKTLEIVNLGQQSLLAYCVHCPSTILSHVSNIVDLLKLDDF